MTLKIGLGIRGKDRLNRDFLRYAAQIGVTHVVVFMPDDGIFTDAMHQGWSFDELRGLKKLYNEFGLEIEGFENFDPRIWYKILLDEDGKQGQMDYIKHCISNMGKAGIGIMGYNFSIGCVTGLVDETCRGGAKTPRFVYDYAPINEPFPLGWAWNTQVLDDPPEGMLRFISREEMRERRDWFLSQILPVAEEAGVKMAAHPEDPRIPILRNAGRVLITPQDYEDMFTAFPSTSNCVEFCQGTFAEMGIDVYEAIRSFGSRDKIAYVHFRNVKGKLPDYTEVFIDEGDVDMVKALKAYRDVGYQGLLMPDHTPQISCANPTETGMAYAIGYIKGIIDAIK